jgi:hydroxylaminobenzene mutase
MLHTDRQSVILEVQMEAISSTLSFMGALLFMLGLLTGFGIPKFRSPRIGVSAHLDAIESGLGLIAFGLLLLHLRISVGWASLIGHTMWISLYVLWLGLLAGAVFGTGKSIPIAGAGLVAKPWQENAAVTLISAGSLGSVLAIGALLALWHWSA